MLTNNVREQYTYPTANITLDALILKNDYFEGYFINSPKPKMLRDHEGIERSFEAVPFGITLPEKGNDQQDLNIILAVGEGYKDVDLRKSLHDASQSEHPIECYFLVYMSNGDQPEYFYRLTISNVVIDDTSITATATRVDLYRKYLGHDVYDVRFKGLFL
jgi:hypothetical protein